MKRAPLLLFAFFGVAISFAQAHPFAPPRMEWLARSDAVYLVRVDRVEPLNPPGYYSQAVTFSVVEVLGGKEETALTLTEVEGQRFKPKDEWILVHNQKENDKCVGWTIEGDPEWWPLMVTEKDGTQAVQFLGPLDGVRQYIHAHPFKP